MGEGTWALRVDALQAKVARLEEAVAAKDADLAGYKQLVREMDPTRFNGSHMDESEFGEQAPDGWLVPALVVPDAHPAAALLAAALEEGEDT